LAPPTGSLLAYASLGNGDQDAEVVLISPDGTGRRFITFGSSNWEAKWSPDGLRFVFASGRDNNSNIFVMHADGTAQARLTTSDGDDREPTWSPDGRRLAFISNRDGDPDLYVMNGDGDAQVRVVALPGVDSAPDWSPDGTAIIFAHTEAGSSQIWRVAPDGSALTQLTHDAGGAADPAWSPDGRSIAYSSRQDGHGEIYLIAPNGSDPRRLTTTSPPFNSRDPDWSPDGGSIAFLQRSTFSNSFLYVMNADGSEVTKVETGATANMAPDWRPGPTSRGTLVFLTEPPSNVAVGQPITPPIRVAVTDGAGNVLAGATDPVTILLTNPSLLSYSRAVLSGTKTVNAVDGVATFDDLRVDRQGPGFLLSASAPELTPATSRAFDVGAGNHLDFLTEPVAIVDGDQVLPPVRVVVRDASGQVATGATDDVSLFLTPGDDARRLEGTTVKRVVNGVATFDDLTVTATGTGFRLHALSGTTPGDTSTASPAPRLETPAPHSTCASHSPPWTPARPTRAQ
jgi:Tol biopolymer transport system component